MANRFWLYRGPNNSEVSVQELRPGVWLADMRLAASVDPNGTSSKQETFSDVRDALRWVGYPIDLMPVPSELA